MKANEEIRRAIKEKGIKQWEVADLLGIGETSLVRKLRKELPEKEKERILTVIENLGEGD